MADMLVLGFKNVDASNRSEPAQTTKDY